MNDSIDYQAPDYLVITDNGLKAIQIPSFLLDEMSVNWGFAVDKYPHLSTGLGNRSGIRTGDFVQPVESQAFQFSTGCFLMESK